MKHILIQICPDGFCLNPGLKLTPEKTNIPWEHLGFHKHHDIFWLVEMTSYSKDTNVLEVKVIEYTPHDIEPFHHQLPRYEIRALRFQALDWQKLKPQLSYYRKSGLLDILVNLETPPQSWRKRVETDRDTISFSYLKPDDLEGHDLDQPKERTLQESFWRPFSEVHISLGHVWFQHYVRSIDQVVEVSIENDHLIPEFDNIKFWFAKKLGTKRIFVKAQILVEGEEVTYVKATSTQIEQIGPAVIEAVKFQRTQALTHTGSEGKPDKSLFTADEMFGLLDTGDTEGNVFGQSDADILTALLEKTTIRNKKQLVYLSGKKQHASMPLRYTLYPHFGFLFYIAGETHHHFVWELLDSHATYMWGVEKKGQSPDVLRRRIEHSINTIRAAGRDPYKRAYREGKEDSDLVFHTLPHEDTGSTFVDSFPRWRQRLEEQLV